MSFLSGLEVARIVEDVVLGEEGFVCESEEFAVSDDGGGVVQTSSGGQA